jgi:hypothetical protein
MNSPAEKMPMLIRELEAAGYEATFDSQTSQIRLIRTITVREDGLAVFVDCSNTSCARILFNAWVRAFASAPKWITLAEYDCEPRAHRLSS